MEFIISDNEFIDRVKSKLKNAKQFRDIVMKGDLQKFYGNVVYKEYKDLIIDKDPTYYRMKSSKANNYAYRSGNPVIVFINKTITDPNDPNRRKNISSEDDFRSYTGMTTDLFLKQVENGDIIPTRSKADWYDDNKFLQLFFEKWNKKLDNKPPIYANAVEDVLTDVNKDFWIIKENDLNKKYKFLKNMNVQPDNELSPVNALFYFAQRLTWLELNGMQPFIDDIESLLYSYKKNGDYDYFKLAELATFHGHQCFSVRSFYSMGSVVTFSVEDYIRTVKTVNNLWNIRKKRGIISNIVLSLSIPLSYYLSESRDKIQFALPKTKTIKEVEKTYDNFIKKDLTDIRDEATIMENRFVDSMSLLQTKGDFKTNDLSEIRNELSNTYKNYIQEVENSKITPHNWINSLIEIGRSGPIFPSEDFYENLLTIIEQSNVFNWINDKLCQERLNKFYVKSLLPNSGVTISVWSEGKTDWIEKIG